MGCPGGCPEGGDTAPPGAGDGLVGGTGQGAPILRLCQSRKATALNVPPTRRQIACPGKVCMDFYLLFPEDGRVGLGARRSGQKGQQEAGYS